MEHRAAAVVVDELALARAGVVALLRARGVGDVVETQSAREALTLVAWEPPALVVVGATRDLPVADAVRRFLRLRPVPPLAVLLAPGNESSAGYLLALGTHAIASRSGPVEEVAAAIDAALVVDRALAPRYVAPGLHGALAGAVAPIQTAGDDHGLTPRERDVLALLAEGRSNREIAAALSVTLATVKSHLVHLYAKLGASNRNDALGRAVAAGLLG